MALACAVAITARGGGEQAFYPSGYVYLPLTIAFTALVWLATSRHGRWLTLRPLLFLGRISYPLYLVHAVLGFEIIRFGVDRGWSTPIGVIVAGIAAVMAATLLHYIIEVPTQRLSRLLFDKPPRFAKARGQRRPLPH
jgi:peptidoglycan/LPS O-acetylase OafA/YrhL